MVAFLNSPLFALVLVPILIGLIAGWLVRESMLLKQYNNKLAQIERDRDLARAKSDALAEQVSMLEADAKKAAFDNQELADRLAFAENDRQDLQKKIREQKSTADALKKETASLHERLTGQDEQIAGLRARIGQLGDQAEDFLEKEAAEKRLHEDLAAAIQKTGELEKKLEQVTAAHAKLSHEKESLHTQLLDYQLKNAEMPGLLAATSPNGASKTRGKKNESQPVAAPPSPQGQTNGDSSPKNSASPIAVVVDDLKIINTITPAQESELFKMGITTIEQLANLSENQLLELAEGSSRLVKKLQKENWIGQARHVLGAV